MHRILGLDISLSDASAILDRLGCKVRPLDSATIEVTIPTHRPDLVREIDLVEEVIRVRGIDAVPAILPAVQGSREVGGREAQERAVRAAAANVGLSEAITFRFTSVKALAAVHAPEAAVVLENPINDHQTVMRTSLLPGLLDAVAAARRHGVRSSAVFSLGPVFLKSSEELPEERPSFAAVLSGERKGWLEKAAPVDAWDAKGIAEALVSALTGTTPTVVTYEASDRPAHLHPRAAAKLLLGDVVVGSFGLLHPDATDAFEIDEAIPVVTLDLQALAARPRVVRYRPIPRFPSAPRDLSVVVHDDVAAGHVRDTIAKAASPLGSEVELFDRFVGASIPKDHASLAFRIVYRAEERTLTDAEVEKAHAKVVAEVEEKFGATLRK